MSDNYFKHQELVKRTKVLATKTFPQNLRLFDRHVGLFYKKRVTGGNIEYLPIQINRKGMADVYGVFSLETRTGFKLPLHVELEFKTGSGKLTQDQETWRDFCRAMGWAWYLVRDEKVFIEEIKRDISVIMGQL